MAKSGGRFIRRCGRLCEPAATLKVDPPSNRLTSVTPISSISGAISSPCPPALFRTSVHCSLRAGEQTTTTRSALCIRRPSLSSILGLDRTSVLSGERVSVSVDLGGRRILKKQKQLKKHHK